jgi:hypothetical protein
MADLPAYFDSQAQAAAMLGLDIYELKEAKAAGCTAFKGGGRIRRDELLKWLEKHPSRKSRSHPEESNDEIVSAKDWENRRDILFGITDFLHAAYVDKRIDLAKYSELGEQTVELVIQLGKVWDVEIDAAGFRKTWRAILAKATQKKNEEKKRDRAGV